jgi:DNA-binding MarR family transcriptional regulator
MPFPTRVTKPLLLVLEVFIEAFEENDHQVHGWAIKRRTGLSGAATYKMLDRLEDAGWITGHWEDRNPDSAKPPRRLYRLTAVGAPAARALLAERRPQALRPGTPLTGFPRGLPGGLSGGLSGGLPGGGR